MQAVATVLVCVLACLQAASLILHALHQDKAAKVVDEARDLAQEAESVMPAPVPPGQVPPPKA